MHRLVPFALATFLAGCGTLIGGGPLDLSSTPEGVPVVLDGDTLAVTPTKFQPPSGVVRLDRAGYQSEFVSVRRTLNPWTFGNVLYLAAGIGMGIEAAGSSPDTLGSDAPDMGSAIMAVVMGGGGLIVDYLTGGMWRYDPKARHVALNPDPDAPAIAGAPGEAQPEWQPSVPGAGPQIEIIEPAEWAGAGARSIGVAPRTSIRVRGRVRHTTGIAEVKINGQRASVALDPSGRSGTFTGFVAEGETGSEVEVAVWGVDGTVRARTFPVRTVGPANADVDEGAAEKLDGFTGQRWAIVIGVSDYLDPEIPDLRYADADARAMYDFLTSDAAGLGGIPRENIELLVNEDATFLNIRSALFTFLKQSTEDDVVLIYLAAHGMPDPDRLDRLYLLAHDTNLDDVAATGVPMEDVQDAVDRAYAHTKIVFTDACHSAGVGLTGSRAANVNLINRAFTEAMTSAMGGLAIFTASEANQLSQEGPEYGGGHGVFTYYLLEGLRGAADEDGDRIVTLGEVMEYTRDRVRRATRNAQIPTIAATSFDRYWPLAIDLR